jgi:hypothetical protein
MGKQLFLNREALLQRDELKIEKVQLTRGFVYVREMTGYEKDVWEQSMLKQRPSGDKNKPVEYETTLEDFRAKLAVVTVCDESGELLFQPKDVKTLNKMMSASNMERIIEAAQRLNAVTEKDKEDILKNLEAEVGESSNSDSAVN